MLNKLKLNVIIVCLSVVLIGVLSSYTQMIGKFYKSGEDFTCCKGDQLFVHHYYTTSLFWVVVSDGYSIEPIGKPIPGGCNIQCNE